MPLSVISGTDAENSVLAASSETHPVFPSLELSVRDEGFSTSRQDFEAKSLQKKAEAEWQLGGRKGEKPVITVQNAWDEIGFNRMNAARSKVGIWKTPIVKWTALVSELLIQQPKKAIPALLDEFGFIPYELFTKVAFYEQMNVARAAEIVSVLRLREEELSKKAKTGDKSASAKLSQTKAARSDFVRALFVVAVDSGRGGKEILAVAESARTRSENRKFVSLDTNGIKVELAQDGGVINSHVPYYNVDAEFARSLLVGRWIAEDEYLEIRRRSLEEGREKSPESVEEIEACQTNRVIEAFLNVRPPERSEVPGSVLGVDEFLHGGADLRRRWIASRFLEFPKVFADLVVKGLVIPDSIFDTAAKESVSATTKPEKFYRFLEFAETVSVTLMDKHLFDDEALFQTFALADAPAKLYEERMKVIQDSRQYSGYRAVDRFLKSGVPAGDIRKGFVIYRYTEKSRSQEQTFIGVGYGDEPARRVLEPERMTRSKEFGAALDTIPKLNRQQFLRIETALRSASVFRRDFGKFGVHLADPTRISAESAKGSVVRIAQFVASYFPEHAEEVDGRITAFRIADAGGTNSEAKARAGAGLVDTLKKIESHLSDILDRIPEDGAESGAKSGILAKKLRFDSDFTDVLSKRNLPIWAYDKDISSIGAEIDAVFVNDAEVRGRWVGKDAYFLAAQAVSKLKIDAEKPLIVVSGGCKEAWEEGLRQIRTIVKAVVKSAGERKANLSIPCTQSGIGLEFARKYLEYLDLTVGQSPDSQFKMFQIAPGRSVAHPGQNEDFVVEDELFALNPILSIIISQCIAQWSVTGPEVVNAGYFEFVRWLETIYEHLDSQKNRIHVVGNGGLFTIAEVNASLVSGSKMVFIKDAGRFSAAASAFLENPEFLTEAFALVGDSPETADVSGAAAEYVRTTLELLLSSADYAEWIKKDWGAENPTHKHLLYRSFFFRFLARIIAADKKPVALASSELESGLRSLSF